jgi:thiol-disulfide isomerase/thioredoxin
MVFAAAAAGKLADQRGARRALAGFGMPDRSLASLAFVLPLAELATAVALLVQRSARWGAVAALVLLVVFVGGIAGAVARGREPDCHCFGRLSSARVGRGTIIRNVLLAVPAVLVAAYGAGDAIDTWVEARSTAELVATGACVASVLLAALCLRLWQENRRLRRDAARGEPAAAELPSGLPVGTHAPEFALTAVDGRAVTLGMLLERDQPVALVFLSPGCPSCVSLLPDLARWQTTLRDRITIALVTAGTMPEARQLAEAHGLKNVLVQQGDEVFHAYRTAATPSGLIITSDGRIASQTSPTKFILEALIRRALHDPAAIPAVASEPPPRERLIVQQRSGALGRL